MVCTGVRAPWAVCLADRQRRCTQRIASLSLLVSLLRRRAGVPLYARAACVAAVALLSATSPRVSGSHCSTCCSTCPSRVPPCGRCGYPHHHAAYLALARETLRRDARLMPATSPSSRKSRFSRKIFRLDGLSLARLNHRGCGRTSSCSHCGGSACSTYPTVP